MRVLSLCLALAILPVIAFPSTCHASKLSDAMKSSADDDDSSFDNDSDHSGHSFVDSLVGSFISGMFCSDDDADDSPGYPSMISGKREVTWTMPLAASYGIPFHGDITSVPELSVGIMVGKRTSLGFYLDGGIPGFRKGSLLDRGAKNPSIFGGGFLFRHYLTRSHTFLSPYLTASVGFQGWFWDYRNSIVVDGDRVVDDILGASTGYAGFGVATKRKARCSVFIEAGAGGTIFFDKTREGFQNDNVFGDFGYAAVKTGLNFRF
jgi:hypothetical protein